MYEIVINKSIKITNDRFMNLKHTVYKGISFNIIELETSEVEICLEYNKDDSNSIKKANEVLAVFGYKIVKPLIDFAKPLTEELKRLADEDDWEADWDDIKQEKSYIYFCTESKNFYLDKADKNRNLGCTYFRNAYLTRIYDFIMNYKEEALKAMDL